MPLVKIQHHTEGNDHYDHYHYHLVKVRHHTETERRWTRSYVGLAWLAELGNGVIQTITGVPSVFDEPSFHMCTLYRDMSKY